MKVALTGISGLIGKAVALELLDHGYDVRGIDLLSLAEELRGRVEMVYADIADHAAMMAALRGCDLIIHCAAYGGPHGRTPAELIRVNVGGTQNVLTAAMEHGIGRVVVTSSVGALGFSFPTHPCLPDYLPIDTDHPRRPQDVYGVSKIANEESAAAATRLSGITTIVFRPGVVVNLSIQVKRHWFPAMMDHATSKHSDPLWGYIDVRDAAVAYRRAIEADVSGHSVYYLVADDVFAKSDASDLIRRFLRDRVQDIDKLTGRSLYDLAPIENALGFKAERTWRKAVEEAGG